MHSTRIIEDYFKQQNAEPVSACDAIRLFVSEKSLGIDTGNALKATSRSIDEILLLKKAKAACTLDMVIHPDSSNRNIFYTTRQEYPDLLMKQPPPVVESPPVTPKKSKFEGAKM